MMKDIAVRNKKDLIKLIENQRNIIKEYKDALYRLSLNELYKQQGAWINSFARKKGKTVNSCNYKNVFIFDILKRIRSYSLISIFLILLFTSYYYNRRSLFSVDNTSFNQWEIWLKDVSFYSVLLISIFVFLWSFLTKNVLRLKILYVVKYNTFLKEMEALVDSSSEKEIIKLLNS